jgi:hypothetical protein
VKAIVTQKDGGEFVTIRLDNPSIENGKFKKIRSITFKLSGNKLITVDIEVKKSSVIIIPEKIGDEAITR